MPSTEELAKIHQTYLKAIDAFSDATAVITRHMEAGTLPTEGELQREAVAVAALTIAREAYLKASRTQ